MAHQSGFGGKIKFNADASSNAGSVHPAYTVADNNLDLIRSPQTTETLSTIQNWTLNENTDNFEAYAKSDVWVSTFVTAGEWDADVTVLVPAGLATAANMQPGSFVNVALAINVVAAAAPFTPKDYWTGQGFISAIDFDDPLDGPVTARIKITGSSNGAADLALTGTVS